MPDTTEIKIDPVKNTLIRGGVPGIVNPFDGCALEAAARIKDKNPDTKIVVLSARPPQAALALTAKRKRNHFREHCTVFAEPTYRCFEGLACPAHSMPGGTSTFCCCLLG